jgi:hypothetical protein
LYKESEDYERRDAGLKEKEKERRVTRKEERPRRKSNSMSRRRQGTT